MDSKLKIYNSITGEKELFEPLSPPFVGLYVCGPTVYNEIHLGNARTFVMFDIVYRYMLYLGYKVRYVRNITDVGHLENDADEGEDKIAKRAKLENLEPMELVQQYSNSFHKVMEMFNALSPNIEPLASGHIPEQIEWAQKIMSNGYAYEKNGSIYFDVPRYLKDYEYGQLSGRKIEELEVGTRDLKEQDEKNHPADFALWKKASPSHIMRWNSPWGEGFPGWHLECSVMSAKYLGESFDIHGGGMDLKFPHHENEIAQSVGCNHKQPVKYWMHANMLTVNGTRMSKTLGNGFLPRELFTGDHPLLEKAYPPMVVRFFMLQTHYRSTLDFSNEALQASEKGFYRLMNAYKNLQQMNFSDSGNPQDIADNEDANVNMLIDSCFTDLNDDFNTAQSLASLFELVTTVNSINDGHLSAAAISAATGARLKDAFKVLIEDIYGLREEKSSEDLVTDGLVTLLIQIRKEARLKKDFATSDKVRDQLKALNIQLKDNKDGTSWEYIN